MKTIDRSRRILNSSSFHLCLTDASDLVVTKLGIDTLFDVSRYACATAKENDYSPLFTRNLPRRFVLLNGLHSHRT